MSDKKKTVVEKSTGDAVHAVVKAGLSALPIVGGPAAELFQNLVQPPLEKRRIEWMEYVGEKLNELDSKGVDIAALQNDENFISAVMYASQIAIRNHSEEKRLALRNSIANVAMGQGPDQTVQHIFMNFIEVFTELHLHILRIFQRPPVQNTRMGALSHVLEQNLPHMRGRRDIYDQVWKDLYLRGLVNTADLHVMMTGTGLEAKRTTALADDFLTFIADSSPADR